jgi:hypothetical protein
MLAMSDARTPDDTDFTDATRQADEHDARAGHGADRMPTPDEERLADQNELDPDVAEAYEDAIERGADVKGEGAI